MCLSGEVGSAVFTAADSSTFQIPRCASLCSLREGLPVDSWIAYYVVLLHYALPLTCCPCGPGSKAGWTLLMNHRGDMSRVIKQQATKQHRRQERRKIGRLENQVVNLSTSDRYHQHFHQFASFAGQSLSSLKEDVSRLDPLLSEYIENLWQDGEPKSYANYTIASVQFFIPESKRQLVKSWRLIGTWNKIEVPVRATPIGPEILLGFAGLFYKWQWERMGHMTVVGYSAYLRTGEMFRIRREHVVLPTRAGEAAAIFLQDTKTTQRKQISWEKVLIRENQALACLKSLCNNRHGPDFLVDISIYQFRKIWNDAVQELKMEDQKIQPYSIRRGGATSAYRLGATFGFLMQQGRWANVATARIYLDEAIQEYQTLTLSSNSKTRLRSAMGFFNRCKPVWGAWKGGWAPLLGREVFSE